eukprot:798104-Alexandrium_andersonii.AAC.1
MSSLCCAERARCAPEASQSGASRSRAPSRNDKEGPPLRFLPRVAGQGAYVLQGVEVPDHDVAVLQ